MKQANQQLNVNTLYEECVKILKDCGKKRNEQYFSKYIECFSLLAYNLPMLSGCSEEEKMQISPIYRETYEEILKFNSFWQDCNDGGCSKKQLEQKKRCSELFKKIMSTLQTSCTQSFKEHSELMATLKIDESLEYIFSAYQIQVPAPIIVSPSENIETDSSDDEASFSIQHGIQKQYSIDIIESGGTFEIESAKEPHLLPRLSYSESNQSTTTKSAEAACKAKASRKAPAERGSSETPSKRIRLSGSNRDRTVTPELRPSSRRSKGSPNILIELNQVFDDKNLFVFNRREDYQNAYNAFDSAFCWIEQILQIITTNSFTLQKTCNTHELQRSLRVMSSVRNNRTISSIEDLAKSQVARIKLDLKSINTEEEKTRIQRMIDYLEALEASANSDVFEEKIPAFVAHHFYPLIPILKNVVKSNKRSINTMISLTSSDALTKAIDYSNQNNSLMWLMVWANALFNGEYNLNSASSDSIRVLNGDCIQSMDLSIESNRSLEFLVEHAINHPSLNRSLENSSDFELIKKTISSNKIFSLQHAPNELKKILTHIQAYLYTITKKIEDIAEKEAAETLANIWTELQSTSFSETERTELKNTAMSMCTQPENTSEQLVPSHTNDSNQTRDEQTSDSMDHSETSEEEEIESDTNNLEIAPNEDQSNSTDHSSAAEEPKVTLMDHSTATEDEEIEINPMNYNFTADKECIETSMNIFETLKNTQDVVDIEHSESLLADEAILPQNETTEANITNHSTASATFVFGISESQCFNTSMSLPPTATLAHTDSASSHVEQTSNKADIVFGETVYLIDDSDDEEVIITSYKSGR